MDAAFPHGFPSAKGQGIKGEGESSTAVRVAYTTSSSSGLLPAPQQSLLQLEGNKSSLGRRVGQFLRHGRRGRGYSLLIHGFSPHWYENRLRELTFFSILYWIPAYAGMTESESPVTQGGEQAARRPVLFPALDKAGWREAPGWFEAVIPQPGSDSYRFPKSVVVTVG